MKLGCIADDFTGATDLANNLARAGMRVVQTIGVPDGPPPPEVDAVVVALKSRTVPAAEAVAQSLHALQWLRAHAAEQVYFKYCSTFDSTPAGNIGPVAEALMAAMGSRFTIATPAFPDNGRTVFKGHLFVGQTLLNESGMQNHPLTPMTDANLVRVLQAQCVGRVGLIDHRVVASGAAAIRARIEALMAEGVGLAIVDAVSNDDLLRLGPALRGMPLVTGGSGVAIGLPANWALAPNERATQLPPPRGQRAIVSGSCSLATNRQVAHFIRHGGAALAIDPLQLAAGADVVTHALQWAAPRVASGPVLVYSTAETDAVKAIQSRLGAAKAGDMVEAAIAGITRGLVERGVGQLLVAGGETSGACVQALGIRQMQIGPQIDPGVPWCHAQSDAAPQGLHLALKSGNFGRDDFFTKAFGLLEAPPDAA
jgi:3-dehydrotetronate 4-kinase